MASTKSTSDITAEYDRERGPVLAATRRVELAAWIGAWLAVSVALAALLLAALERNDYPAPSADQVGERLQLDDLDVCEQPGKVQFCDDRE